MRNAKGQYTSPKENQISSGMEEPLRLYLDSHEEQKIPVWFRYGKYIWNQTLFNDCLSDPIVLIVSVRKYRQ